MNALNGEAARALAFTLERGEVTFSPDVKTIAFLNAEPLDTDSQGEDVIDLAQLKCEQPFRSAFLALQQSGYDCVSQIEIGEQFDAAMVLLTKHRRYNEMLVARATKIVRKGGRIIVSGEGKSGAASVQKWLKNHVDIEGSTSKFHCRTFWFSNSNELPMEPPQPALLDADGLQFQTRSGMFSANEVDMGSALLARHLDGQVRGAVADLGAGWGYLAAMVARSKTQITTLDLYEADHRALECAKQNLSAFTEFKKEFYWRDLASEQITRKYDWIVMNPPFHAGREKNDGLGQQFVKCAAQALRSGGRMLMVANTKLPYERTLAASFKSVERIAQEDGFKLILAQK